MYQRQYLRTEPQTTAHLAQTMSLLKMNNGELIEEVEKILNENPALERVEEIRCPQCNRKLSQRQICPKCSQPNTADIEDAIVFLSPRNDFQYQKDSIPDDEYQMEDFTPDSVELPEYVLRQIMFDLADSEREIAAHIIMQVDEDGFVQERNVSIAQYFHVPISKVEKIRNTIMHADPIGVCATSPEEAMLIQLDILRETVEIPPYYNQLVEEHIASISKKDYKKIAKELGLPEIDIKKAARFISENLNPYPGRASWGNSKADQATQRNVYTNPDIIVKYLNNDPNQALMVEIIIPYGGNLRVSSIYKKALKESGEEKKEDLKPDFDKANLFIKCLQQRNNTMRRMLEKITKYQVEFIRNGDKFIHPITRADLAEELEVHESTISRAVANKSLQLPDGKIVPLSKFFDRSLGIRTELKEIVAKENRKKPLSDSKIAEILKQKGFDLARRTIAKYRTMEGIDPAYMRKNQYNESK
jgi:RNA polymerase sigma-54 factor